MPNDDYRRSATDRVLAVRARGDLQSVEVAFGGQASFVVKDPVAGESFHLSAIEHRLLEAMRQPISLRGLQRIVEGEFAPRRASVTQLQQFVTQLHQQGLLVGDNPGQGAELLERGQQRTRRNRWASLMQVLSIRVGGFNAGPLIEKLYGAARCLCSPWAIAVAALVLAYAALVVLGNGSVIASRLPALAEFVHPRRLPLWITAIAGVKVMHELGHAMACRHFGARPQEMGLLLLAGAPALYCDVSDAWRLPSKWQRMAVSSAGMAVELMIASVAAIVWWHAAPGMLSAVCLSLIVVCSVGTLVVNANPLLRYDGYYLLADWLEVPNLSERARGFVGGAWRRWLLGEPPQGEDFVSPGKGRALWAYAILSKVYLSLVLVGVFFLMIKLARPYSLQNVVYTLAAVTLAGLLLRPATATFQMMANPSVRRRLKRLRVALTFLVLGGLAAGAWFWPLTRRVEAPLVAVPADAHPVFAIAGGELTFAAKEGASVDAGDVIARLSNPDLELSLAQLQGAVREKRVHLEQLRTLQAVQPAAARTLPTAAAELADAQSQLAEQQRMVDSLVIRAPIAGVVLAAPPRRSNPGTDGKLPVWSGSPLAERNRGAWIDAGTPLAVIATPASWVGWAAVDQADVPAVEAGQAARVLVDEHPTTVLEGRVTQVSRRARDNRAADAANSHRDDKIVGDARYHVVELSLASPPSGLLAGARGTVKIATYDTTLGELAWLHLQRLFTRAM